MKYLLMSVLLAAAGWVWYDRTHLSESEVIALYKEQGQAWSAQDSQTLCEQIDDDFSGTVRVAGARVVVETVGKDEVCESAEAILSLKEEADKAMAEDEELGWSYRFELSDIRLSADRKTAQVRAVTHLNMGKLVIVDSESMDTIGLRNGKPVFLSGDAQARYSGVMGAALSQSMH